MPSARSTDPRRLAQASAARGRARGMTLIEIMVVMVIIAVVLVGVIGGTGQLGGARLKHTATSIDGAIRVAFTRATATSKSLRLVFDIDGNSMWLEEGDLPMLVQHDFKNKSALDEKQSGNGGADPATEAEKDAIKEGQSIVKGPKVAKPRFTPVNGIAMTSDTVSATPDGKPAGKKGPIPLPRGIRFRSIQTGHDDAPHTTGRGYLYFWPGGQTERASIQIRIGDSEEEGDTLTLLVAPLTGKVTVKNGPADLIIPLDDKSASDREDNGF